MDVHRIYMGDDRTPHDRHLHAEMNKGHSVTDHLFKTPDGKTPNVKVRRNNRKGTFNYSDKPLPPGALAGFDAAGDGSASGPCACPLCVDAAPALPKTSCQCPSCLSLSLSPAAPVRAPQTVEDLMNLLRVYKPGKKILQVAGDLDIVETKVCMLPIEQGVSGQSKLCFLRGGFLVVPLESGRHYMSGLARD